ncbi:MULTISPECIES: DNA ligase D [Bacillus]|uniref:DNA ligase D n=1 Tax=Bacillus TaxID=1386 RepID=UPI001596595A|nr:MULTISPECIES: DNA ligase D [Bacillus]
MIKPMLPTLFKDPPEGDEWVYEVKYDGFRCIVIIGDKITLQSRAGNELNQQFPDIVDELLSFREKYKNKLPIKLDAELSILSSEVKADFSSIQKRGRTKTKETITKLLTKLPASLCVFDLLEYDHVDYKNKPYMERKTTLHKLLSDFSSAKMIYVPSYENLTEIWNLVKSADGEGIIAKKKNSKWEDGKRTTNWIKTKNFKSASCFITRYEKSNGYFHLGVFSNNSIVPVGLFSHGLDSEERTALLHVIKENKTREDTHFIEVPPNICVDIFYLELYDRQLRHPEFHQFRFDLAPEDCTLEKLTKKNSEIPATVTITNPDKPLWDNPRISKADYLQYLVTVAPYMLPFLKDRLLTVIRYPHGMSGESFYQKNCPDYAPTFVHTARQNDTDFILCNNIDTLCWLGNQLAIEFHIPFQSIHYDHPSEIVFDLDPPSIEYFSLAIQAALMMKEIFDQLKLQSFLKTSGRKGLQVYIPLPDGTFTYEMTRKFTQFIAEYLISKEPSLFTVERLKKNRGNRLYIDYLQHWEGKTIIAPYSPRGTDFAGVATPLYWNEVNDSLQPDQFTLYNIHERLVSKGGPFSDFFLKKEKQPFEPVLQFLNKV